VKPTGTRHFVYDSQGRVVAEYGASASEVKAEFIWAVPPGANDNSPFGGDDGIVGYAPLALVAQNGLNQLELYWVHGNHLGVPLVTTNALGQVVDPGNDFLRPGFPGQSQVLSDLYYNRARDYDPVLGRYIQADPIGLLGGANPYLYANGDPVNMIDPYGEFYWWAVPVGFALWELGSQAYDLWRRGCDPMNLSNYDYWDVGIAFASGLGGGGLASGATRKWLGSATAIQKGNVGEFFARGALFARGKFSLLAKTGKRAPHADRIPGLGGLKGGARNSKPDFAYRGRDGRTNVLEAKYSTNPPRSLTDGLTSPQRQLRNQLGDRFEIYRVTESNVTNAAGIAGAGAAGIGTQVEP
jgi:RHS repeat-associated protein